MAAAFSPDGGLVATASNDETVAVWDATTGQRLHVLEGHVGSVNGIGFGIDGTTLYTSAADGSIMLWDIAGAGGVARRVTDQTLARWLHGHGVGQPDRRQRRRGLDRRTTSSTSRTAT